MPLLIGGATTSRTHTAVKIEPGLSRRARPPMSWTPAGPWAWSPGLLSATEARPGDRPRRAPNTSGVREQYARGQTAKARTTLRTPASASSTSTGHGHIAAHARASWARAAFDAVAGGICPVHRLVAVLRQLGADRPLPADPRGRRGRRGRHRPLSTKPARCWTRSWPRSGSGPRAWSASGRPEADGDDIVL